MRILLAEDEKSLARAIVTLLKKHHYEADAVYDGAEALAYLQTGNYDAAILDILQACGARFQRAGDAVTFEKSELHGVDIDLADCPDLGPILMVLGLFCEGETVIRNAGRLRIKESDRIAAMEEELRKFGGKLQSDENTVTIQGSALALPGLLHGHNDHRVVMALSVAALGAGYTARISGAQAVAKSWPGFFAVLQQLGAGIEVEKE